MAKCRVVKGGWMWKGVEQVVGAEIDESVEWIENRMRDGLVHHIAVPMPDPVIEQAVAQPSGVEVAVAPRQRAKTKK